MQEAKKIVDFIADELYGEQVIRSKEQVAELLDEDEPESVRIKREKYNARTSKIYKIIGCISLIVTAVSAFLLILWVEDLKAEHRQWFVVLHLLVVC